MQQENAKFAECHAARNLLVMVKLIFCHLVNNLRQQWMCYPPNNSNISFSEMVAREGDLSTGLRLGLEKNLWQNFCSLKEEGFLTLFKPKQLTILTDISCFSAFLFINRTKIRVLKKICDKILVHWRKRNFSLFLRPNNQQCQLMYLAFQLSYVRTYHSKLTKIQHDMDVIEDRVVRLQVR